jgi:hypothetical protein
MNGGGVVVYVNHAFGIDAEFQGYGSLSKTFVFRAAIKPEQLPLPGWSRYSVLVRRQLLPISPWPPTTRPLLAKTQGGPCR